MRAREQAPPQPTPSLGLRAALALGWTGKSPEMDLSHLSQSQKQGTCLGFPVRSQAPCASGRLLAGGLPSRPQKQAMVSWAQNCQAPEVKAQMPCQPVPGENIWGLGNGP